MDLAAQPSGTAKARLLPQAEALDLFPANLASLHRLLPLRFLDESLVCAGTGPFDLDAMSMIQFRLQKRLMLVKVPEDLFVEAFEKHYGTRLYPQGPAMLDAVLPARPDVKDRNPNVPAEWSTGEGRILVFQGAKGGVGTTSVAANLAVLLAQAGHRVGYFDASFSNPTAQIALGAHVESTLRDVRRKKVSAFDAFARGAAGVRLLIGEPGDGVDYSAAELTEWFAMPNQLRANFDYTIVDLPAGNESSLLDLAAGADLVTLVTDAEGAAAHNTLISAKAWKANFPALPLQILFNNESSRAEALKAFSAFKAFAPGESLAFAGCCPPSRAVSKSWMLRTPLALLKPTDPFVKSMRVAFAAQLTTALRSTAAVGQELSHQAI